MMSVCVCLAIVRERRECICDCGCVCVREYISGSGRAWMCISVRAWEKYVSVRVCVYVCLCVPSLGGCGGTGEST